MLGVRDYNSRLITRNDLINGKSISDTIGDVIQVTLSVQPVTGLTLKNIKDSIRDSVKFEVYTLTELQTYENITFHQIEINNEWFNIHAVQNWTTLLRHFKYALVKVNNIDT